MEPKKTHREAKKPQISARYLADYMTASETARRTIVQKCKYQPIAKVIQHDEAKIAVSKFIRGGGDDISKLREDAQRLRDRIADDAFDRDLFDHNADYIDRFADVASELQIPESIERLAPGASVPLVIHGVSVSPQLQFRLKRTTKSNKLRVGAGVLRYAKGKALLPATGEWQSAFLLGYLRATADDGLDPEAALCLTVDAYTGIAHRAPGDSATRFKNMGAACQTIFERWPAIKPPKRRFVIQISN